MRLTPVSLSEAKEGELAIEACNLVVDVCWEMEVVYQLAEVQAVAVQWNDSVVATKRDSQESLLPPPYYRDDIAACRSHAYARHTCCLSMIKKHVYDWTDKTGNCLHA